MESSFENLIARLLTIGILVMPIGGVKADSLNASSLSHPSDQNWQNVFLKFKEIKDKKDVRKFLSLC